MFDAKKETKKIVEFIRDYYQKNNLPEFDLILHLIHKVIY